MRNIIWLASYPKSGNTWVRAFLSYLLLDKKRQYSVNNLVAKVASSRALVEEQLCIETSDFADVEIAQLRNLAYTSYSQDVDENPLFIKIHDAYSYYNGVPIVPKDVSIGVVYIVRNPLDIVSSFAHHNNDSIENTIKKMENDDYILNKKEQSINIQLSQRLLSWSGHVKSWIRQQDLPFLIIRFEDLLTNPLDTFTRLVEFSQLSFNSDQINEAIVATAFEKLKDMENTQGFYMKNDANRVFFRKGQMNSWKQELTNEQIDRVIKKHSDVMQKLGYI